MSKTLPPLYSIPQMDPAPPSDVYGLAQFLSNMLKRELDTLNISIKNMAQDVGEIRQSLVAHETRITGHDASMKWAGDLGKGIILVLVGSILTLLFTTLKHA